MIIIELNGLVDSWFSSTGDPTKDMVVLDDKSIM